MRRVGILGGTFNPPHIGHLVMANEAFHAARLDEVRFMPNFIAPHKEVSGGSAVQRLEMVKLAIADHPSFAVEPIEIDQGGVSYSVETMARLIEREPDTEFHFIIGGDMAAGLKDWHRIDELCEMVRFIGVSRPGYEAITEYPVDFIQSPEIHLSSTLLRERAANGATMKYLVPDAVESYIRKEHLYGPNSDVTES